MSMSLKRALRQGADYNHIEDERSIGKTAAVEEGKREDEGVVDAFAFCSIVAVPTKNRFEPLHHLSSEEWPPLPLVSRHSPSLCITRPPLERKTPLNTRPIAHSKPVTKKPPSIQFPVAKHVELPLPGHTVYPPPPPRSTLR